jgi:hypothetical protein
VQRLVAALVLVIFASLSAIDGVCCPDGCTNEAQNTSPEQHAPDEGVCMLCTGGVTFSVPDVLGPAIDRSADAAALLVPRPKDGTALPPDHPPRL